MHPKPPQLVAESEVHNGWHCPLIQPPVANAYTVSLVAVYTTPSATVGTRPTGPTDVHKGAQTFGDPEQFRTPAASNAYNRSSATYTTPSATTGVVVVMVPVGAVHNGEHALGVPEQFVMPCAS